MATRSPPITGSITKRHESTAYPKRKGHLAEARWPLFSYLGIAGHVQEVSGEKAMASDDIPGV